MSKSTVIVTFFTIIYGLMLADLFFSVHKLIRNKAKINWHWFSLAASWYLLLIILKNWWDISSMNINSDWFNLLFFILYGHLFLLIFLTVSVALPDEINENISLKDYYFQHHRYFWGLMSGTIFLSTIIFFFKQYVSDSPVNYNQYIANFILILINLLLAYTKKQKIHAFFLVFLTLGVLLEIIGKSIN